jgi:nitroimidazol reductase NimA-like FMN-containing flavoprotein (pyridoxamine 5'-phosphate oxidase superfamily)
MTPDAVEEISREECLRLLQGRKAFVGRIGFIVDGRPMVLPVNYLAGPDGIVFCTGPGVKLDHLAAGAPVAFEIDADSPYRESGWSVVVQGVTEEIKDPEQTARLRRGALRSWGTRNPEHWIRISLDHVEGRRIREKGTTETSP